MICIENCVTAGKVPCVDYKYGPTQLRLQPTHTGVWTYPLARFHQKGTRGVLARVAVSHSAKTVGPKRGTPVP